MITAAAIKAEHSNVFTYLHGRLEASASRCDSPGSASSLSLVFASDVEQLACASRLKAAIVIVHSTAAADARLAANPDGCYFSVDNVPMGMATLLKYFDQKRARFRQWGLRHATALVHADAQIGADVVLGPYCVVGAGALIGDSCMIGAHSVVENNASIGAGTVLHPHVFVGSACVVGSRCEIHPHTTIGSDGFGYAVGADGRPRKIAHLGNVVIGDDVEIGSCCSIDRATLESTHVRSGNKLDNLCHIAHNCDLGENGFYTAGFMMGGSTTIGRGFVTGGNSVVTAHVTLGDNVSLAGRSTVTNDLPHAGAYGGYPLQPLKEAMKTLVNVSRLNEMRKTLNLIVRHLKLHP